MTWCVSRAKILARWKNFYYIVQDTETYVIGITLLILTLIGVYFLLTFESKPRDIFYCITLTIQTLTAFTSTFNPKGSLLRFHYAQFLIIPFWMTQILNATFVSFISRIIYENQINSVHDIALYGHHLAGEPHVLGYLSSKNMVIDF